MKRNSNIELLRLICILLIIIHHLALYSNIDYTHIISINSCFLLLFTIGGKLGANCFFAISSYYLVNSNKQVLRYDKAIKTHNIMLFYSVSIFIINYFFRFKEIVLSDVLESFLPLFYNSYWFVSSYLLLLLFYPLFNVLIKKFDEKQYKLFLFILLVIVSSLAFLPNSSLLKDPQHFVTTVFIYFLVGYINRKNEKFKKSNIYMCVFIVSITICLLISFSMLFLGNRYKINILSEYSTIFMSGESFFTIASSVSLMYYFLHRKAFFNTIINNLSKPTLDVYLIHMNHLIYLWIWNDFFKIYSLFDKPLFPIYALIITLFIYLFCIIIGYIRIYIFMFLQKIGKLFIDNKEKC